MRFPFQYSLVQALVLYVVLPLILALGVAGYLSLASMESRAEEKMQEELQLVARALQQPLSHAVDREREGSVRSALESAFQIHRVYGATVFDEQGEKIASIGAQEDEVEKKGEEELIALTEEGERQEEYGEVGGEKAYSYFVPLVESGGRINGLLQVSRKEADFRDHVWQLRMEFSYILAGGAISMTLLVLLGHRRALGRHLQFLENSMQRVKNGDRNHRLYLQGPREISAVASTFNTMLDSLDRTQIKLEEHRKEQSRLEKELRRAEKMAATGRLAAGVAHELGSPLSTISGLAQRAARKPGSEQLVCSSLEQIQQQVKRMEAIVRQLLDFSRQNVSNPREVDPARIVKRATHSVAHEAREQGANLRSFASGEEGVMLVADPLRLEQMLVNLLRNSLQATPQGEIELEWSCSPRDCTFVVRDDGPGIDPENISRVCDPFFTTKSVGEGTGLGLAVVHGIVEEHGGSMHICRSALGGAEVTVTIPRSTQSGESYELFPSSEGEQGGENKANTDA